MKKLYIVLVAIVICLSGCANAKGYDWKKLKDNLVAEGIPEGAIRETERDLYHEIYVHDAEMGYATIHVYKKVSDAKKYWANLEERYDNLNYSNETTAVGNLKDVCDASIEEWVYYEENVIISVEQYVANEWAIYIGEDGEEYYGDGTKVSDVKSPTQQREAAYKLEEQLMNCLK